MVQSSNKPGTHGKHEAEVPDEIGKPKLVARPVRHSLRPLSPRQPMAGRHKDLQFSNAPEELRELGSTASIQTAATTDTEYPSAALSEPDAAQNQTIDNQAIDN